MENYELIPWINDKTKNIFISLEAFATSLNICGNQINVSFFCFLNLFFIF